MDKDRINKIHVFLSIFFLLFASIASYYLIKQSQNLINLQNNLPAEESFEEVLVEEKEEKISIKIEDGDTFSKLLEEAGLNLSLINKIYEASFELYDLAKIKTGYNLDLYLDSHSKEFKSLYYRISNEEELEIECQSLDNSYTCQAERRAIPYEIRIVKKGGRLESSLYLDALAAGIDERAIIEFAKALDWSIDFASDPRLNDEFKLIYEERYLDGKYQLPGTVLAGEYINDGKSFKVFYFKESEDNEGYFDEYANSVQKIFLKAPLEFKYISSGFTTGLRYIEAFNIATGHRAIDYAASLGTPIRSVGDGTVVLASYNGSYGNMIKIRHNATYQTNYGHMSKFAVKLGDKVKQGDIIGYVGSTGLSTGPHLHYEMEKHGIKINPLLEVLPPGKSILEENKELYFQEIEIYKNELKQMNF